MSRQVSVAVLLSLLPPVVVAAETVDTAWVRRYDGPEHGQDWATCLAVDSQGNVYVAGPSAADTGYVNLDYVVIKYRPNGDLAWLRRYDFGGDDIPSSLGVDASGNVYVTGSGAGRTATIKYDSLGRLPWLRTLGSGGGGNGLVLDPWANVLICGAVTAKYRPNGETAWTRFHESGGIALAADAAGGICLAGAYPDSTPRYHYLAFKYDSSGSLLWETRCAMSTGNEFPSDMALDSAGNVCITGTSSGTSSGLDYLTIKYSPEGETLWTRRYNGPANDRDEARAVAVDGEGNVYVTGHSYNYPVSSDDYATVKYDASGSQVWVVRYNSPDNDADAAYDLAVDADGNVYVTGRSRSRRGTTLRYDCLTIAYDPAGETLWTHRYDGPASGDDEAWCVTVDDRGNVYVAGLSCDLSGGNVDIIVVKYVQSGAVAEPRSVSQVLPALTVEPGLCRGRAALTCRIRLAGRVRLTVRDAAGRRVRCLVDEVQTEGVHVVVWDLCDAAGRRVPAGVYVIELQAGPGRDRVKIEVLD